MSIAFYDKTGQQVTRDGQRVYVLDFSLLALAKASQFKSVYNIYVSRT